MRRLAILFLPLIALVGLTPAAVRAATVLYSQLQLSDDSGYSYYSDNSAYQADDFVVSSDAAWTVTQVKIVGQPVFTKTQPSSLTVRFYANNGTTPGALLATRTSTSLTVTPSGTSNVVLGPNYLYTIRIAGVSLSSGHYWISVANTACFQCFGWEARDTISNYPAAFSPDGTSWYPSNFDFLFELDGQSSAFSTNLYVWHGLNGNPNWVLVRGTATNITGSADAITLTLSWTCTDQHGTSTTGSKSRVYSTVAAGQTVGLDAGFTPPSYVNETCTVTLTASDSNGTTSTQTKTFSAGAGTG